MTVASTPRALALCSPATNARPRGWKGGKKMEGLERYWRRLLLLFWLIFAILALYAYWTAIGRFALGDTDDNMRMMQVRALLSGQDWYDLRQYRLDPPGGADIHWSRLVDLPI